MKALKSIKWRLQLWYGLLLLFVLAGLGFSAYQMERGRQFQRVDQELHRRIGTLTQQLRRPPRGHKGRLPLEAEPSPPGFPEDAPPRDDGRPQRFAMAPQTAILFETNWPGNFYFRIRRLEGGENQEVARSENYPVAQIKFWENCFARVNGPDETPGKGGRPPAPVDFQENRAMAQKLPSGELIEVGCSITRELHELRRVAWALTGFVGGILLFGLVGGGWLVSRALRPIAEISAAAVRISGGDLAQRINVAETEGELGQLAAVLNATFARLETAFAQQKQFASDAAHELRTPVSVILTQTQMALARERDAASYKQTVEACQRAAQRMRKLIETLLELARFDAGQETLQRQPFDLSRMVMDGVELVLPLAGERKVKVTTELKTVELAGDAGRLGQVAVNLLTNAIQYNRPGGEVRVKLTRQDGLAVLEISDTGPGIAAEDLPHVFERFYRADKSRTGGGSSGLGLSICQAIIEAHGGTIDAASQLGQGSTFTVRLPLLK
jgi:two-component system, OmpR family, sensor kinase